MNPSYNFGLIFLFATRQLIIVKTGHHTYLYGRSKTHKADGRGKGFTRGIMGVCLVLDKVRFDLHFFSSLLF